MGSSALFNVAAMEMASKHPAWVRLLAVALMGFTCNILASARTAAEARA